MTPPSHTTRGPARAVFASPAHARERAAAVAVALGVEPAAVVDLVELVAERVVSALADVQPAAGAVRIVDAAELAEILEVRRETVYRHAVELGGVKPFGGSGPWRFDLERARDLWSARSGIVKSEVPGSAPGRGSRRGRGVGSGGSSRLLPIRGEHPATEGGARAA